MLTKKIQRHERPLVIAPPSTGPTATAMPVMAPKTPKAVPRSRPLKAVPSSASDVANMMAPPTPWRARDTARMVGSPAAPQSAEPAVKTTMPTAKTIRRPTRSAIEPAVSSSAASDSAYASMTHCRSESVAPSDCWMSGSATFTIVTSSRSMKTPVQTATSVHHLRSMGEPPGEWGAKTFRQGTPQCVDRQLIDDRYLHDQPDEYPPLAHARAHRPHRLPAARRVRPRAAHGDRADARRTASARLRDAHRAAHDRPDLSAADRREAAREPLARRRDRGRAREPRPRRAPPRSRRPPLLPAAHHARGRACGGRAGPEGQAGERRHRRPAQRRRARAAARAAPRPHHVRSRPPDPAAADRLHRLPARPGALHEPRPRQRGVPRPADRDPPLRRARRARRARADV